ncbi:MAG: ABC transporter ATP-binding protein [Planctomycetaceae bacterium]|nr:ABC transporter ATP-binding protein [Planctomycetaceae bacterium]
MTDHADAALRVKNGNFYHGRQQVLRDVTLDLHPGRHYILAGPNGAGKSTLLDILAGLRRPASGEVMLEGRALSDYGPPELSRRLALAPQEYNLNFAFTVREIVAMGRRPYLGRWGVLGEDDQHAVDEALAALHLGDLATKSVTALSGGERRRVVVARALAQATPILLLDEPVAGLDIAQAMAVMALAKRLAEAGRLVLTVSHDLNLAAAYGHELVFLKEGRVVAAGPVEAVFTNRVLEEVYETPTAVRYDEFSASLSASFRLG